MGKRLRHRIAGYNVYMAKSASERYTGKGGSKGKPSSKKVRGMPHLKFAGERVYMNKEAHKHFKKEGGI